MVAFWPKAPEAQPRAELEAAPAEKLADTKPTEAPVTAPEVPPAKNAPQPKQAPAKQDLLPEPLVEQPDTVATDSIRLAADTLAPATDSLALADTLVAPDTAVAALEEPLPAGLDTINEEEQIIVGKEQLIRSLTVNIVAIDPAQPEPEERDSLLAEVSGMPLENQQAKTAYTLEYWQSPIRYKGYKMANNKIVLFGLDRLREAPGLFQLDEGIYLRHGAETYLLEPSFDFRAFRAVSDQAIIDRLQP
ncbi:MAG: hypothetical protein AAGB22_13105 [Bacteroidota bacterium]